MVTYKWFDGKVPEDKYKVTQVYGIFFNTEGEMLIAIDQGRYTLPGGKPEVFDKDREDTLRREAYEEVNITFEKAYFVGYQLADKHDGEAPIAQIRMTAIVDRLDSVTVDPATGRLFKREFVNPYDAIKLLSWDDVGEKQVKAAMKIASEKFGINFKNNS